MSRFSRVCLAGLLVFLGCTTQGPLGPVASLKPLLVAIDEGQAETPRAPEVRNGNIVLARLKPIVDSQPEPLGAALLLVDTSASRALGLGEELRILRRLSEGIARSAGPKTPIVVAAYDQTVEAVFDGAAGDFGDAALKGLRRRLALGASNLGAALAWAGEHARARAQAGGARDGRRGDRRRDRRRYAARRRGAAWDEGSGAARRDRGRRHPR